MKALYSSNMKKMPVFVCLLVLLSVVTPTHAVVRTVSKPDAPTITSVSSSAVKKGKQNITVTFSLGASNGGAAVKSTVVKANGKSCTAKKTRTSCTIKGIKSGTSLNITASSKNKKGAGPKSAVVAYVAGNPAYSAASSSVAVSYPAGSFAGEGTFVVGLDIQPGTYFATADPTWGGYWKRLSCATGEFDCIIANDLPNAGTYVTILASDKYFSTTRMSRWLPESALTAANATSFAGEGTFKVGFDIQPGTYQATADATWGGYWKRLSCVTADLDCIITNDLPSANAIVTIAPTDAFFHTSRMSTWTKID